MNLTCFISADPDLTGPGIRLATMIPVGEVVFVAFIWIFCRHRVHSELLAKLSTSICHLNALQLMTAAVFLAIAYSKCQESDWFHTLFVLHIAAVSIWSTLLAATIIPGWFTTKISQFPALIACFVLYGIELDRLEQQISAAHEQECFTDRPYIIPLSWMRFGFVFVFAFLFFIALFNRETSTEPCNSILRKQIANWKSRYLLLLQFLPFFGIGVGFYATFYSYSARKWILSRSEDDWTAGQIMPLCFVVVGSVADVWNIFELDAMLNNALCVFIKYSTDKIISATCSAGAALATFLPSDGPEVQKHLSNV